MEIDLLKSDFVRNKEKMYGLLKIIKRREIVDNMKNYIFYSIIKFRKQGYVKQMQ